MFKTELAQLHTSLNEKQTISEELRKRVDDIDTKLLRTKEHKQLYLDSVSQCCPELLSLNVGGTCHQICFEKHCRV